jgi:glycosyltransferase involved in cell wall biosynthesis
MKILWLTWKDLDHPLAGGAEVVNEELAKRLAADGHDVVFFTAGFQSAKSETRRGEPNLTRHGYRIVRVGSRFTSYLAAPREYLKRWRDWPDLVIDECNTMPYFASYYTRGRQVLFIHMLCRQIWFYEFPLPLSTVGYLLEPLYLRLLRRKLPVITISDSTRQDLIRQGYQRDNIHVISEGIQLQPIPDLSAEKFPEPTVLSLGSIRSMKRTLDQVKAFELAKKDITNLQMKLVGNADSRYGKKVLEYIAKSPHSADIEFLGPVDDPVKTDLMRQSHTILSTSVKEGWGLIVTEAASQGTPAIVYDVDGLRDSVRHGRTGLVTSSSTPAAMASAVTSLLTDQPKYNSLRDAAWQWSREITFDQAYTDFKQALGIRHDA